MISEESYDTEDIKSIKSNDAENSALPSQK